MNFHLSVSLLNREISFLDKLKYVQKSMLLLIENLRLDKIQNQEVGEADVILNSY